MDCTCVPCAKYGLELRYMHNGGSTLCTWQQAMHRLYVLVYTKHGQASGMQRRVTILTCRLNTEVRSNVELCFIRLLTVHFFSSSYKTCITVGVRIQNHWTREGRLKTKRHGGPLADSETRVTKLEVVV